MDNQLALDISWLAGMWDADGCYCAPILNSKGGFKCFPVAKLANTNETVIASVVKVLQDIGVGFNMETHKAKRSHKELHVIKVNRLRELSKFCEIIIPYSRGKKAQAELIKVFVDSRLARTTHAPRKKVGWSEEEKHLLARLHVLNAFGRREKQGVNDCTESALAMTEHKGQSAHQGNLMDIALGH